MPKKTKPETPAPPAPAAPTPARDKALMVYLGQARGQTTSRVQVWRRVTPFEMSQGALDPLTPAREHYYDLKQPLVRKYMRASVGQVVEFELSPADSVIPATRRFVGVWPDQQQVLDWAARDRAERVALDLQDADEKASKLDPLKDALDPLRNAYFATPSFHRRHLLHEMIAYITRGA